MNIRTNENGEFIVEMCEGEKLYITSTDEENADDLEIVVDMFEDSVDVTTADEGHSVRFTRESITIVTPDNKLESRRDR